MAFIERIVSGGQTGADRGGLDAAMYCDVPHSGWCPKARIAEDGVIPEIYKLKEMNSKDYLKRTEANVVDSDLTLVFAFGKPTGGSKHTIIFCETHQRPHLHIDFSVHQETEAISYINSWLSELSSPPSIVINIAGSRESNNYGLQKKVMRVVTNVLNDANKCGKTLYPIEDKRIHGSDDQPRYSIRRSQDR